jgi:RHS repeat-associated protein
MKRISRRNAGGTAWVLEEEMRFIYEGWNLLAEVSTLKPGSATARAVQPVRSYLWGEDLSGTETGAGGVGGLLMVRQHAAAVGESWTGWQVPCLDGNGNVLAYLDGDDGEVMSRYEYDPFGRTVVAESVARYSKTGTAAGRRVAVEAPPFRFSTKYQDRETGLVCYGFRYYAPEWGRWLSRDPIGERGGMNLYGMVGNDPVNFIDYLGLDTYILLYYSRSDQQAFKQAAETQKRELEASSTFNKACDKVIIKGALTSQEFETAWNQAKTETTGNDPNLKVKEVRVFSHSGPGELHFKGGSLNSQQIANLSGLNWKPDGKVVCHGCNSGVNNASGQPVAGGFAQGQGVQSQGQTGYSQFSTDPKKRAWYTRIGDSSKSVYLWSHGDGGKDNTFGPTRPPNTVPPTEQPAPQTPAPATPTPAPPLP